jgi:acyl-coenzyme A synthetase/AMP-(fatty) acid ligase
MRNPRFHLPFSALSLCFGIVAVLAVAYIGLIAVVMSYGASTVAFSQSVRDGEAEVAELESAYLAEVARIADIDYVAEGYAKPFAKVFVRAESAALR